MIRHLLAAAATCLVAGTLSAQQPPAKPPVKPAATEHQMDHSKMGGMDHAKDDHGASPWKELDAYHMLMMATWHPAKEKSDMAPTRAKIGEMVTSALTAETQSVADLVARKADDATLKTAMKGLHDKFEVIEEGCVMPKGKH